MEQNSEPAVTRRSCLLGAIIAPLVGYLPAIVPERKPYDDLAVMGDLNGISSVSVQKEAVSWMVFNGWKIRSVDEANGRFQMERCLIRR